MQVLIENATIIYKNGLKKIYEVISITEKGVYIGEIKSINDNRESFIHHGFIPKNQIQQIMVVTEKGKVRDIELKSELEEEKNEEKTSRNMCTDAVDCHCFTGSRDNE